MNWNFLKIGSKHIVVRDKTSIDKKREALSQIMGILRILDFGETFEKKQKFAKYDAYAYSDQEVKTYLLQMKKEFSKGK